MVKWFYVDNDKARQGPIKEVDFIELFQKNTITPETLVWNGKSVKDWCTISSIEGVEDAMRNWKPGYGQLMTSSAKPKKEIAKNSQAQQPDEHEVKKRLQVQEKAKEQQAQTCPAAETTDNVLGSDEPQKQTSVEWTAPTEDEKKKEWEALEAIIQNKSDALDEKYSESMENLVAKVTDLELRLSKKVGEVEELKKKLQIKQADTPKTSVAEEKNSEESKREGHSDSENASVYSAANFEKLKLEKDALQAKTLALTEEHRLFTEKINSQVTDLESKLSKKVNEVNELKEKLQTSKEWAKLEEERRVFNNQFKTLCEEQSKFEKFKATELARIKSSGGERVRNENNSGLFAGRWTLIAVGLVSVVGYKMITRAIKPMSNTPPRKNSGGEKVALTLPDALSSKLPSQITSFFKM